MSVSSFMGDTRGYSDDMQISGDGMAAGERTSRHALRALLVLGGFVAIWWALMTGVAQADSTPHRHLLDQVRSQVPAQHHETPVRDAVRRAHHDVKTATQHVRHEVRDTARPVTHTVSTVVDSTPLPPVAAQATKTIRTTVSTTVAETRALVTKSADNPVVTTVEQTVKDAIAKPESSTGQGNSHSSRHSTNQHAALTGHSSSVFAQQSATPGRAQTSTPADAPGDRPLRTPSLPGPCSSPSGSGTSSSSTPVGVTESSYSVTPTVLGDHHTWRLARLPVGPAYQPGSSPD
jgi:hypothetical protein